MKVYEVKYKSYNRFDYSTFISARNKKEVVKLAKKAINRNDDRDTVISIKLYPAGSWSFK